MAGRADDIQLESHKDDIPLLVSTEPLRKLIEDLDDARTKEALEEILDNDTAWAVIAASHRPDTATITLTNKAML